MEVEYVEKIITKKNVKLSFYQLALCGLPVVHRTGTTVQTLVGIYYYSKKREEASTHVFCTRGSSFTQTKNKAKNFPLVNTFSVSLPPALPPSYIFSHNTSLRPNV